MSQQAHMDQVQEFVERYLELEFQARLLCDVPGKMEEYNALLRQLDALSPKGRSNPFTFMIPRGSPEGEAEIIQKYQDESNRSSPRKRPFYKISYYDVGPGIYLCYVSGLLVRERFHLIGTCLVLRMTSVGPELLDWVLLFDGEWGDKDRVRKLLKCHVYLNHAPFSTHSPSAFRVLQKQECNENFVFQNKVFASR